MEIRMKIRFDRIYEIQEYHENPVILSIKS